MTADEAVKIIATTGPMEFERFAGALPNGTELDKPIARYNKQLEAIRVIGERKLKGQVFNLIPYLNYISNAAALSDGSYSPTNAFVRKVWPTYGAIANLPDAVSSLQQYCLDKWKPREYRIAAFLILRDLDKAAFSKVRPDFDADFQDGDGELMIYIRHVEDGSAFFWGVPDKSHFTYYQ